MKTQIYLALILLFILPSLSFAENKTFDGGVFFSTWGTGIQGNYYYTNEILFGGDFVSRSEEINYSGTYSSVEGTLTLTTYEAYARYYFRELELTDGFFGQGGLAIRNWTANAEGIENRYARHRHLNGLVRNWVADKGLSLFPEPGFESISLSCVANDGSLNIPAINKYLRETCNAQMDQGYGKIKGKTFRINNMGNETEESIQEYLELLDQAIEATRSKS